MAQIATAGLGITLTAASLTVFYSMGYSYAEYGSRPPHAHTASASSRNAPTFTLSRRIPWTNR